MGRGGNEAGVFHSGERRGSWLAYHSFFTHSPEPSKVIITDGQGKSLFSRSCYSRFSIKEDCRFKVGEPQRCQTTYHSRLRLLGPPPPPLPPRGKLGLGGERGLCEASEGNALVPYLHRERGLHACEILTLPVLFHAGTRQSVGTTVSTVSTVSPTRDWESIWASARQAWPAGARAGHHTRVPGEAAWDLGIPGGWRASSPQKSRPENALESPLGLRMG